MSDTTTGDRIDAIPSLTGEEHANRLHALIVCLRNIEEPAIILSEYETTNIRGTLLTMAVDESRALLCAEKWS